MSADVTRGPYDGAGPDPLVVSGASAGQAHVAGTRGAVRELVAWCAANGLPVDAIRSLDARSVRVDPVTAVRLARQLRGAAAALRAARVPAVGWDGPAGLAGGVFARWPGVVCTTGHGAVVAVSVGAATLTLPGGQQVTGWDERGVATTPGGPTLGVQHVVPALARLSGGWGRVVLVPATSVVAGLVVTVADAAERCARAGAVLRVSAG